ncbi:hypothetical protein ACBP93_04475 [Paenalcaligenes hominis]|uniref:hypothetical protein n=1 Tax=Paenalcaligenes hominis TaxID=643674 RepID=UPI00352405D8
MSDTISFFSAKESFRSGGRSLSPAIIDCFYRLHDYFSCSIMEINNTSNITFSYNNSFGTFVGCKEGGFDVIVLQVRSFFDGVYFVKDELFLDFGLHAVRGALKSTINTILNAAHLRFDCNFLEVKGVWCSHPLPYHYFYDYLPGLQSVISEGFQGKIYSSSLGGYLGELVGDAFNENQVEIVSKDFYGIDFAVLGSLCKRGHRKEFVAVDEAVKNLAKIGYEETADFFNFSIVSKSFDYIVLLSLIAGKREVINQVALYAEVMSFFSTKKKKVLFVVDGITSVYQSGWVKNQVMHDRYSELLMELYSRLPAECGMYNISCADPLKKISCCNLVDFFLTDNATSSIYVDRFCKKPGVVFGPSGVKGHIHVNSKMYLIDSVPGGGWDRASYSIDVQDFMGCLESLFDKLCKASRK